MLWFFALFAITGLAQLFTFREFVEGAPIGIDVRRMAIVNSFYRVIFFVVQILLSTVWNIIIICNI